MTMVRHTFLCGTHAMIVFPSVIDYRRTAYGSFPDVLIPVLYLHRVFTMRISCNRALPMAYLWLFLDVPPHELFAFWIIQDDNLDTALSQQVLAAHPVHILPNHDAGYLVEQNCAGAHDARTIQNEGQAQRPHKRPSK